MIRISPHRLVLVAALLFCFISFSYGARSLGVATRPRVGVGRENGDDIAQLASRGVDGGEMKKKEEEEEEEMVSVDYTPARKKPPIHN